MGVTMKQTQPPDRSASSDAMWCFIGALSMGSVSVGVHGGGNPYWNDQPYWWVFALIAVVFGLLGVRFLAIAARNDEGPDTKDGD
jgi:hypothetical protein